MIKIASLILLILLISSLSLADDLYRVRLSNQADAKYLNEIGVQPVVKIFQGYLIIADDEQAIKIEASGIDLKLSAVDVNLDDLYIDARQDDKNAAKFTVNYEDDDIRLVSISDFDKSASDISNDYWPINYDNLDFQYSDPKDYNAQLLYNTPDLEYIMSLIETDSLVSYTERLQAFNGRVVDTDSNRSASQWINEKLQDFGYSPEFDDFTFTRSNTTYNARNVMATKAGLTVPEHDIILCAHFDAVPGSPGADDNGSGTAGVLELARILKNIETDLSFVFILFDGEEMGLHGAYHYSSEAYTRGDNIEYVLNLDMIAHYENSDSANLFHSDYLEYGNLCSQLGDSLLNLTVEFGGSSGGSDHYPFSLYGWEVGFLAERIFSNVYHSSHDSTTYMNFDYMTAMVKLAAATTYSIDYAYIPEPTLAIEFPDGIPLAIPADEQYLLRVDINELYGGQHLQNSCQLHYWAADGSLVAESMTEVEYGQYESYFPALESGSYFNFFVTVEDIDGFSFSSGSSESPYLATSLYYEEVLFSDNFESDLGWTTGSDASSGFWERAIPVGSGIDGSPVSDFDGSGSCFMTGSTEFSDVDNGTVFLYSPTFEIIDGYGLINFGFWFNNGSPKSDTLSIYLRKQGVEQWVLVKSFGPIEYASGGWHEYSFWVNHIYPVGGVFQLRIDATDGGFDSPVEAAIDAFSITKYLPDPLIVLDDIPNDWTMGQPYSFQLNAEGGVGEYLWIDFNQDLIDFELSISLEDGLISGIPSAAGIVDFTVWIGDEMYNFYQKPFTFTINEPVLIGTEILPDGVVDVAYNELLEESGGTGIKTWTEIGGSLESTGLVLSGDGILSGIVNSPMDISFTAHIEDITGSFDEQEYSIEFEYVYIFGDANGDESVNVGDAVFLVNNVFKDGPAPYPLISGDANCDTEVNVGDAVYIINHVFKGGPEPSCD